LRPRFRRDRKEEKDMRTLLATTAFASLLAFGATAQQATEPAAPATDAPAEAMPAEPAAPALPDADAAADETMEPATDTAEDATDAMPDVDTAEEPAAPGAEPLDGATTADVGPVLTPVAAGDISADRLIGAQIQTVDGEDIAEVEDVLMAADGSTVESVVAQFGGFLGFGSNKVELTMDEIEVMQDESGTYVVQTSITPESLEGRPEYEAAN
jgi:sporulation protein YlmC with PRC-barrel domain